MKHPKIRRVVFACFLLFGIFAFAERETYPPQTISVSGNSATIYNRSGSRGAIFEENITGSPATVSIVIRGCMRTGPTCDVLETNTSTTASQNRSLDTKAYDYFTVTASWTGGTSPSVTVTPTLTTADGSGSSVGAVSSVFGRTGDVIGAANDYSFAQIGSLPTTLAGYGITDGVPSSRTVAGHPLSGNVSIAFSDLTSPPTTLAGYGITDGVPTSRTVAGHALSSNVSVAFADLTSPPTTLAGYGITNGVANSLTVNGKALSGNITLSLASADYANQGTTTTVLHGNGAGNPAFGSIVNADIAASTIDLTAKVTGVLPVANGGSGAATFAAHTFLGNNTGSTAAPSAQTIAEADVASLVSDLALKAPLLSPSFTTPALGAATGLSLAVTGALSTGAVSGASGLLNFLGSISGTATITGPATAGTSTNPFTFSNNILAPVQTCANPSYAFTGFAGYGLGYDATGGRAGLDLCVNGAANAVSYSNGLEIQSGMVYGWAPATNVDSNNDTGVSRPAAAVVAFGSGASGSTVAKLKASGYMSLGTKFTTNAGCGESAGTTIGGATAGKFTTAGSTSCTSIVTTGDTATAPNGWSCWAHDLTTSADYNNPRCSSNGTTITIVTGTIVSGDVIEFGGIGY